MMRASTITISITAVFAIMSFAADLHAELMRGAATLSPVSSIIKISREGNRLDSLVPGEPLYIFTESGKPVSEIYVKDVFSDVIHSEPLPDAVARQIRETRSILIFSNRREYGEFIKAFRDGSVEAFEEFISRNPQSELREEAQRILDGLVYRPYKVKGTHQAFDEFLKTHPDNYYAGRALKRRDELRYMPVKAADTISEYRWFLYTYPDNLHVPEVRERMRAILAAYGETNLKEVARNPGRYLGKKVRFPCTLHSALPIYVEGPGVGRKTDLFKSPRNSIDYLNFQVREGEIVLWRLFASREAESVVKIIEESGKGDPLLVYGMVFDSLGGAPWIDVDDVEKY